MVEGNQGEARAYSTPPCFRHGTVDSVIVVHGPPRSLSRSHESVHDDEATRNLDASRSKRRDTAFAQRCRSLKVLTGAPDNGVNAKANSKSRPDLSFGDIGFLKLI